MKYKLIPIAKVNVIANPKIKGGFFKNPFADLSFESAVIRNQKMTISFAATGEALVEFVKKVDQTVVESI